MTNESSVNPPEDGNRTAVDRVKAIYPQAHCVPLANAEYPDLYVIRKDRKEWAESLAWGPTPDKAWAAAGLAASPVVQSTKIECELCLGKGCEYCADAGNYVDDAGPVVQSSNGICTYGGCTYSMGHGGPHSHEMHPAVTMTAVVQSESAIENRICELCNRPHYNMEDSAYCREMFGRKKWVCWHCDFATSDDKEAAAHFGDRDDPEECKPLCKWWQLMAEDERIGALQDTIQQLNDAHAAIPDSPPVVQSRESTRPESLVDEDWRRMIPLAESIIALLAAEPNHLVRIGALKSVMLVPKYKEASKR